MKKILTVLLFFTLTLSAYAVDYYDGRNVNLFGADLCANYWNPNSIQVTAIGLALHDDYTVIKDSVDYLPGYTGYYVIKSLQMGGSFNLGGTMPVESTAVVDSFYSSFIQFN